MMKVLTRILLTFLLIFIAACENKQADSALVLKAKQDVYVSMLDLNKTFLSEFQTAATYAEQKNLCIVFGQCIADAKNANIDPLTTRYCTSILSAIDDWTQNIDGQHGTIFLIRYIQLTNTHLMVQIMTP